MLEKRMKSTYKHFVVSTLLICNSILLLTDCSSLQTTQPTRVTEVPQSFGLISDTSSSSTFDFSSFFFDENLRQIVHIALQNNFDALIALQRIEMARSQVTSFKGALFPRLDIGGTFGQRRFGAYTMDGVGNYDTQFSPNITQDQIIPEHLPDYYLGGLMAWEVDVWGKLKNKKKAAVERYLGSVDGRKWALTVLIEEIALTYYELISYDLELEIVNQTIELQQAELQVVVAQKEAGRTDELVVKQFEAQVLNTRSLALVSQQRILELENKLNVLMGRFPQPIARTKNSFDLELPIQKYSTIPAELLSNRMDIKQAEREVLATKADLKAAKMAFFPSLTINAGVGFQSFNPQFFLSPASLAYQVMGGLVAPVLNRSAIKAEFQYANAAQLEAIYNYQKSTLIGYVEIYNQMAAISNYNKAYALKSQEVDVLNYAITTSFDLFVNGRVNYLEIIFLRRSALQAKLELIAMRKQQYTSIIGLYKAIGGGGF
jgi:NodT family efflux transporter outer membrane factor (OMF) lipoprotein